MSISSMSSGDSPALSVRTPVSRSTSTSSTKKTLSQRAWVHVTKAASPFFFAAGGTQSDDHLVEVVRRDPALASRFIKSIALFSSAGNLLVVIACVVFLSLYWSRCANCDRPLRWWLLVQAFLQASQLPVRVVLLVSVRAVEAAGGSVEACIISLTASPAWRMSKTVALFQYGWFVLGMVWWMHTGTCPTCPGIGRLVTSIMLLSAARAAVALAIFKSAFAPPPEEAGAEAPKVVAATQHQITSIPLVRYVPPAKGEGTNEEDPTCSICLTEYIEGDFMRRLPCGHDFHPRCIDKWLRRNKRCPLCIHAVDVPCEHSHAKTS